MSTFSLLLCQLLPSFLLAVNPGLRLRITEDGLNYANKVAVESFSRDIQDTRLEDISGKVGFVQYKLTNLIVQDFKTPKSSITLASESDLEWKASKLGLEVDGSYEYIFRSKGGGDFTVTMSDFSFSVGMKIGIDEKRKPTIKTVSCSSNIGPLKIKFRGKKAWIYNLFSGIASRAVSVILQSKVCERIRNIIDKSAEGAFCSMEVQVPLGEDLTLDYGLLSAPSVTSEYIEADLKGEVFWRQNQTEAPFKAPEMATIVDNKKMVYLTLSDYLFNTLIYQAHKYNLLAYNLTAKSMLVDKDILNTTCENSCIGKLIPQIGEMYPNSQVELHMKSTEAPFTIINEKTVDVFGEWNISMFVRQPNGSLNFLFGFDAVVKTSVKLKMTSEALYGKLQDTRILTNITSTAIGPLNDSAFQLLVNGAVEKVIEPTINDYIGADGLPLPSTDTLQFKDSDCKLLQNTIIIETNLKYTPVFSKDKSNILRYQPLPMIRRYMNSYNL